MSFSVAAPPMTLDATLAARLARIVLGHAGREYPHKLDQVLTGPGDLAAPRALHPLFYGSFDWHSCVHGFWLLARTRRRFPALPEAGAITALFRARLTPEAVAGERDYLRRPMTDGFERPYGWAWLLKLQAELLEAAAPEAAILAPLAEDFAGRLRRFLPKAAYPVRAGTHANTAFAVALALDYAAARADAALAEALRGTARAWYGADTACQAWEPSGEDFLSPALVEAEAMRRALPRSEFLPWLGRFLPRLAECEPATLFRPAAVADRSDGRLVHLDGLNLSRGWCFRSLAAALAEDDPRRAPMLAAAEAHLAASLPHVAGDYMGEHWLATFALLALSS